MKVSVQEEKIISLEGPKMDQANEKIKKLHEQTQIVWSNVSVMLLLHFGGLIGIQKCFGTAQWATIAFFVLLLAISKIGIGAGAHRLWAHRSYKAKWPLRLILMLAQSLAYENSIFEWSRDHRVHHKYSETNADPHNANRGFFFAHMGWLLCKKHPEVIAKGKLIDLSDLHEDKIVMFQHKYYKSFLWLTAVALPTFIPWYYWNESLSNSFFVCTVMRSVMSHHSTWLVNSAAHFWGRRPYDKHINPAENLSISLLTLGEGFHNYHHTFPFDYAASELGYELNINKLFIDLFALVGWAYDRKTVSPESIELRKTRTGDKTAHELYGIH